MELEIRDEGEQRVLYHKECAGRVHLGKYRVIFCPTCMVAEDGSVPERVLCCYECNQPLVVTEGHGSFCVGCNYHPSMQDTFFDAVV